MKHNNQLPNAHFHKHWQRRVRTWFDQPAKKQRRRKMRLQKRLNASRPLGLLRPLVHCPTIRYNTKLRGGRGFTVEELSIVGLSRNYARTIGIAVDCRRRDKSEEALRSNIQRLRTYLSKLVLKKSPLTKSVSLAQAFPIEQNGSEETPRAVTTEERDSCAFLRLKKERLDKKNKGARDKKALEQEIN